MFLKLRPVLRIQNFSVASHRATGLLLLAFMLSPLLFSCVRLCCVFMPKFARPLCIKQWELVIQSWAAGCFVVQSYILLYSKYVLSMISRSKFHLGMCLRQVGNPELFRQRCLLFSCHRYIYTGILPNVII